MNSILLAKMFFNYYVVWPRASCSGHGRRSVLIGDGQNRKVRKSLQCLYRVGVEVFFLATQKTPSTVALSLPESLNSLGILTGNLLAMPFGQQEVKWAKFWLRNL